MNWLAELLAKYPELAVYLALAIGFWVGNLKIRGFSLGGTTGSLLAGIAIGLLFEVPVSGPAKSLVFLLFLFGIGYEVGPKFFSAMKGDGWRFAVLAVFMPVVGLLTAWAVARQLGLDPGFAAGMLSGALTESPAMGTAAEAIGALAIPEDLKAKYVAHIGVADALCYVAGALGVIVMCSTIGPRLLGIDLKAEALKVEAQYGITRTRAGVSSAWRPFEFRAYRIRAGGPADGRTAGEAERLVQGARTFVLRLRRDGEIVDATGDTRAQGRGCRRGGGPSRGAGRAPRRAGGGSGGPRAARRADGVLRRVRLQVRHRRPDTGTAGHARRCAQCLPAPDRAPRPGHPHRTQDRGRAGRRAARGRQRARRRPLRRRQSARSCSPAR